MPVRTIPYSVGDVTRKVVKKDARWLAKHPHRQWRIRDFIQGEDLGVHDAPPAGTRIYVIVQRTASGGQTRRFLASNNIALTHEANNDAFIETLFVAWALAAPNPIAICDAPDDSMLAMQINALRDVCGEDDGNNGMLAERIASMVDPVAMAMEMAR